MDVVSELPYVPTPVGCRRGQLPRRDQPYCLLDSLENPIEGRGELRISGRGRLRRQAKQIAQLVHVEDRQPPLPEHGDGNRVEPEGGQLRASLGFGVDVPGDVLDLVTRKELLRSGARGSARPGVESQYLVRHVSLLAAFNAALLKSPALALVVMPAQTGIQEAQVTTLGAWVPAFAGTTG